MTESESNSELAAPSAKRQCTRNVAENPNSAWSNLICLVRQDAEKEKDQLRVRMLLSLTFENDTDGDVDVTRERFSFAAQQLVDEGKEEVLVQYFLAMFERNKSWRKWPDEAKSETISAMCLYFGHYEYPKKLEHALVQALAKAANSYCPGIDPDCIGRLIEF